ncbi:MAG: folate-binding protein YgfZ [Pseudonocardiales bacterium]|nr:MAG: folate-binding protein YgfZ [Pseudonocardiales bacterium]
MPHLPGAVGAEGVDAGVATHYGDPFGEQRALTDQAGLVDRGNRGVVAVSGADRLSWLHSLTTQHLTGLPPLHGTESLILSPHGHIEHHLVVAEDGRTTWLDVEPATVPALLAFLDSMRFMLRVDPADVSGDWAVLTLAGPAAPAALTAIDMTPGDQPYDLTPLPGGGLVRRMPGGAFDLLVPRAAGVAERLVGAGVRPAGMWAYEALRVAARRPRLGWETDHRTIVQEGGWIDTAVHLDKGCYRGQETVARVHNLGRPPRKLVLLHLDGSAETLPAHGAVITLEDRPVGFVGTAVRHHELGPIALAIVRRNTADDAPLRIDRVDAAIETAVDAA